MDKTELAYAAGFFDGEGCVQIHKRKPRLRMVSPDYMLMVSITNTCLDILIWFKDNFGGSVHLDRDKTEKHQAIYGWGLSANQALSFLQLIQPFVKLKRNQVDLAVLFQQLKKPPSIGKQLTQEELYMRKWCSEQLQRMKKYGKNK